MHNPARGFRKLGLRLTSNIIGQHKQLSKNVIVAYLSALLTVNFYSLSDCINFATVLTTSIHSVHDHGWTPEWQQLTNFSFKLKLVSMKSQVQLCCSSTSIHAILQIVMFLTPSR